MLGSAGLELVECDRVVGVGFAINADDVTQLSAGLADRLDGLQKLTLGDDDGVAGVVEQVFDPPAVISV